MRRNFVVAIAIIDFNSASMAPRNGRHDGDIISFF